MFWLFYFSIAFCADYPFVVDLVPAGLHADPSIYS